MGRFYRLIDRPGSNLDSLRGGPVSWQNMARGIGLVLLAVAAALGCSSASPPRNEMAPTPKLDPPVESPTQTAIPPTPTRNDGIAARINNEIITWKDVLENLKDVKPGDVDADLKKSNLRQMAEERMFMQAAKANNL